MTLVTEDSDGGSAHARGGEKRSRAQRSRWRLRVRWLLRGMACWAGAPLTEPILWGFEGRWGGQLLEGYGPTEASPVVSCHRSAEQRKIGSVGPPLPGVEVRIVDPHTLQDVAAGDIGEIWLKGRSISTGYWQNPKVTADSFCQGWFKTGDLGRVDPQGYFYLTDRMKNIIISGGENISPKEIEAVINQMERVDVAVVVGIPDQRWGEKVVAAVVLKKNADLTAEQVMDTCRENLHDWKCPREIAFVKEIPRNVMGKVLVDKVRDLF